MGGQGMGDGTRLAIGVLLLWVAAAAFFVAFMSGHSDALTVGTGKDASGKTVPVGPRNVSELVARASAIISSLQGGSAAASSSSTTTTDSTGGVSA